LTAKQYGKKYVSPLNEIQILSKTMQDVKRCLSFFEKILIGFGILGVITNRSTR
jgi:hypothetical protein